MYQVIIKMIMMKSGKCSTVRYSVIMITREKDLAADCNLVDFHKMRVCSKEWHKILPKQYSLQDCLFSQATCLLAKRVTLNGKLLK